MKSLFVVAALAVLLCAAVHGMPRRQHGGYGGGYEEGGFGQEEEYGHRDSYNEESGSRTKHKSGSSNFGVNSGVVEGIGGGFAAGLEGVSTGLGAGLIHGGLGASGAIREGFSKGVLGVHKDYREDESESFNNKKVSGESFGHGHKSQFGQAGRDKRGFGNFGGSGFGNFGSFFSGFGNINQGQNNAGFIRGQAQEEEQYGGHLKSHEESGSHKKHKSGNSNLSVTGGAQTDVETLGVNRKSAGGEFGVSQSYNEDEDESFNDKKVDNEFIAQGHKASAGQAGFAGFGTFGNSGNNRVHGQSAGFQAIAGQGEEQFAGHVKHQEQSGSHKKHKSGSSNLSVIGGTQEQIEGVSGVTSNRNSQASNEGKFGISQNYNENEDESYNNKNSDSEFIGQGHRATAGQAGAIGFDKLEDVGNKRRDGQSGGFQIGAAQQEEQYGGHVRNQEQSGSHKKHKSGSSNLSVIGGTQEQIKGVAGVNFNGNSQASNEGKFGISQNYNENEDESYDNKKSDSEFIGQGQRVTAGQAGFAGFGEFGNSGNNRGNDGQSGGFQIGAAKQEEQYGGHVRNQEQSGSHKKHKSGSSNLSVIGGTQEQIKGLSGVNSNVNTQASNEGKFGISQNYNENEDESYDNKKSDSEFIGQGQRVSAGQSGFAGFGTFGNFGNNRGGSQSGGYQIGAAQQEEQYGGHVKNQEQSGSHKKHKSGSSNLSVTGGTQEQIGHLTGIANHGNYGNSKEGNFGVSQNYEDNEDESFNNKKTDSESIGQGHRITAGQAGFAGFGQFGNFGNNGNHGQSGGFQIGAAQQGEQYAGHIKHQEQSGSHKKHKSGTSNLSVIGGSEQEIGQLPYQSHVNNRGQQTKKDGKFGINQNYEENEDESYNNKKVDGEFIGHGQKASAVQSGIASATIADNSESKLHGEHTEMGK